MDRSALHIAAERGHTGVVEILIDRFHASIAARTKVLHSIHTLTLHYCKCTLYYYGGFIMSQPKKSYMNDNVVRYNKSLAAHQALQRLQLFVHNLHYT